MASEDLKKEIHFALENATLGRTLGNFCKTYPARREKSYAGVDFEKTREKIAEVKSYAAEHIDEMIAEFTTNCEVDTFIMLKVQKMQWIGFVNW